MPCGFRLPAPGSAGVPAAAQGGAFALRVEHQGGGEAAAGEGRLDFRGIAVMQRIASPRQPPDDPHSPADLPVARVLAEIGIEVGQVGALGKRLSSVARRLQKASITGRWK